MAEPKANSEAVLGYHEATKHSVASVRRPSHMMDWTNQPRPWKLYDVDLPEVGLSPRIAKTGAAVQDVLLGESPTPTGAAPTLGQLAAILQLSAGVTKRIRVGDGYMHFRAAACTGALYHIELYVITGDLDELPAGVYQYGAHDNTLRQLREGDFRAVTAQATGRDPESAPAITIAYTSTFWRNAWKYASRAYRHSFWDSGTIIAHSLATAKANALDARVVTRFEDMPVNNLLDVDGATEASVALLEVGPRTPAPTIHPPARLDLPVKPLSRDPLDFPLIREAHDATSLDSPPGAPPSPGESSSAGPSGQTIPLPRGGPMSAALEDVILKRGSSRRFADEPISLTQLSTILDAAGQPVGLDGNAGPLNNIYVIGNTIDGLSQGIYRYLSQQRSLELVTEAETRSIASHLSLDQPLGGDAAADIYFVADLPRILEAQGARGYRTAHLDASIRAGRVYLAAYALGLGASGLTFYDDEVVAALQAPSESAITFLVAVGKPGKLTAS